MKFKVLKTKLKIFDWREKDNAIEPVISRKMEKFN